MNPYIAELMGTAILIVLGDGVVANVVLSKTKGNSSGWIVITAGWALAVFTAVACVGQYSGAHINPAVSIGLAVAGLFDWALVPGYIAAQFAGAILGACVVFLAYYRHYEATDDPAGKLATFCTGAEIRCPGWNNVTEIIGTFVLVFGVLHFGGASLDEPAIGNAVVSTPIGLGSLGAVPVGLLVFAIGLSLGGPTGYAINPARDLGPRLAHAILPIPGKGGSDWGYAWIPVFGPIVGALIAAGAYTVLGHGG